MTDRQAEWNSQSKNERRCRSKKTKRLRNDRAISTANTWPNSKTNSPKWVPNCSVRRDCVTGVDSRSRMGWKTNSRYTAYRLLITKIQIIWNVLELRPSWWRNCPTFRHRTMNPNLFWESWNLIKTAIFWSGCCLSVWWLSESLCSDLTKIQGLRNERSCRHTPSPFLRLPMRNPLLLRWIQHQDRSTTTRLSGVPNITV
jgi:hypothetical protein